MQSFRNLVVKTASQTFHALSIDILWLVECLTILKDLLNLHTDFRRGLLAPRGVRVGNHAALRNIEFHQTVARAVSSMLLGCTILDGTPWAIGAELGRTPGALIVQLEVLSIHLSTDLFNLDGTWPSRYRSWTALLIVIHRR